MTLHWMTVGCISASAIRAVKDAGGKVVLVRATPDIPAIFMVGIPCQVFSRSTDMEIKGWNEIFITVPTYGLSLTLSSELYKNSLHIIQVPVDKTRLALVNEKMFN